MKKIKKILAVLLTAIFVFSFVACSKDSKAPNGDTDTEGHYRFKHCSSYKR